MRRLACIGVSVFFLSGFAPATGEAPSRESAPRPRIETDFSRTANLVHWLDNLAGTSVGKTQRVYQSYWERRFGPMGLEEREALASFARLRRMDVPVPEPTVSNESGCLPVHSRTLTWHQIFLAESMKARSIADLRQALSKHLAEAELKELVAVLEFFRPRFEKVWGDLDFVERFQTRFRKFLDKGKMLDYLGMVAEFLGVDPGDAPTMKISFIGLPSSGATHAEADGEYLLIEIRPGDEPEDQIQVVAHEATHFLMRRMTTEQLDQLAKQAYAEDEAGALVWLYLWEGLPTALGQGLAEARLGAGFSASRQWYHINTIDHFAKLIYPVVDKATKRSQGIEEAIPLITRALEASPLFQEAPAARLMTPAFYATGEGMEWGMERLRQRLGLGNEVPWTAFDLGDPSGVDLLRRYTCLGGIALVSPKDLERAAAIDGVPLLPPGLVDQARQHAKQSLGVIAVGRRQGGGTVYFLVAPQQSDPSRLIETFARLRGIPAEPIVITGNPRKRPRSSP